MKNTKFLVMDVDGTLTDGKIYMGQTGEIAKAFDIKDGCGILLELPKLGIIPVIITARESSILKNRCDELKIEELYQGVKDKLTKLREIVEKYGESLSTVAYAGDDLPDVPCMEAVKKEGGLVVCPANAIPEIKALADYVSTQNAGDGAIRDIINHLSNINQRDNLTKKIKDTVSLILSTDYSKYDAGEHQLDDGTPFIIQEYTTKDEEKCVLESHRKHIDIQYMMQGSEVFKTYSTNCLSGEGHYNEEKDIDYWYDGIVECESLLVPGSLIIIYNGQPHKGAITSKKQTKVKKLVCKIDVNY